VNTKTQPVGFIALQALAEFECQAARASNPTITFDRLCQVLSDITPGLGCLWSDYCTYLQSTQPRPDLN
jgi:hypothetical protein